VDNVINRNWNFWKSLFSKRKGKGFRKILCYESS